MSIENGTSPLIVFRKNGTKECIYTKSSNINNDDIWFEFNPINNDTAVQHYSLINGKVEYTPPEYIDPSTLPNPNKFLALMLTDLDAPLELFAYSDLIKNHSSDETKRKAFWTKVKNSKPAWLTDEFLTKIEDFAIQANLPLK